MATGTFKLPYPLVADEVDEIGRWLEDQPVPVLLRTGHHDGYNVSMIVNLALAKWVKELDADDAQTIVERATHYAEWCSSVDEHDQRNISAAGGALRSIEIIGRHLEGLAIPQSTLKTRGVYSRRLISTLALWRWAAQIEGN